MRSNASSSNVPRTLSAASSSTGVISRSVVGTSTTAFPIPHPLSKDPISRRLQRPRTHSSPAMAAYQAGAPGKKSQTETVAGLGFAHLTTCSPLPVANGHHD